MQRLHGRGSVVVDDDANSYGPGSMAAVVRLPAAPAPPPDWLGFRKCG